MMLGHTPRLRTLGVLAATAIVLGAGSAPAFGAGAGLCVGGPSSPMMSPGSDGQCKKGYTLTEVASQADLAALQARVGSLESKVGALETDNSLLKSKVSALETESSSLKGKVSALESTLSKVSYDATGVNGKPTVKIEGANLQVVSGTGYTTVDPNGLGNVFIGYNHNHADQQTGSHNLVIGDYHSFTSYGGLLAGFDNTVSGRYSSALGRLGTVSGDWSTVTAGIGNTASGLYSSVSGGTGNTASGTHGSVSGGIDNTASGNYSSVSGGVRNTASAAISSILGGADITLSTNASTSPSS